MPTLVKCFRKLGIKSKDAEEIQGLINSGMTEEEALLEHLSSVDREIDELVSTIEETGTTVEKAPAKEFRQISDEGPLGRFMPLDAERVITLRKTSNLSTFLHESAHLFLHMEGVYSAKYGISEDQQKILDFLEVDGFDKIDPKTEKGREAAEKFAETFEVYLRTGEAPSKGLVAAFSVFKQWLTTIYQSLTDPRLGRAELSDDIRGVFDRMLATQEQIEEITANPAYSRLFDEDIRGYMSEKEEKEYTAQAEKAKRQAVEDLDGKLLKQYYRKRKREWVEERTVIAEREKKRLLKSPIYSLMDTLEKYPMDRYALEKAIGRKIPKSLSKYVTEKKNGINPQEYADAYNYTVSSMVKNLTTVMPLEKAATNVAEQIMLAKYGDIFNDGTLEQEVIESVHNEEQKKLLLMELRALNRKAGKMYVDTSQMKMMASKKIQSMQYGDIDPGKYYRGEVKAAKKAATAENDIEKLAAKEEQVANHYLYSEAIRVKKKMDSMRRKSQALKTKKNPDPKTVHPDYVGMVKELIAAYDYRSYTKMDRDKTISSLLRIARWARTQMKVDGMTLPEHAHLYDKNLVNILNAAENGTLDQVKMKTWKDMTFDEMSGVDQMIKHLMYLGRKYSDEAKAAKELRYRAVADSINKKAKRGASKYGKQGVVKKLNRMAQGYGASLILHADSILRRFDGFENLGPMYRAVKSKVDQSMINLVEAERQAYEDMDAIYREHYTDKEARDMNKPYMVGDLEFTKWQAVSLTLNWGSISSREAVLNSTIEGERPFTQEMVTEILNTLTEKDLRFVQSVFDYNETFRKELFALEKRLTGVAPTAVDPAEIVTKVGSIKGGYYPLKYDGALSLKVSEDMINEEIRTMRVGTVAHAHTKDGMVQERKGSGGKPVLLDMMVWHRHTQDVLRRIHLTEAVIESQAVIADKNVIAAAEAANMGDLLQSLDIWIKDVAAGEIISGDIPQRVLRNIRTGFTISTIGWNLSTILVQPLGLFQSMPVVGYRNVLRALIAFLAPGSKSSARARELSAFMRKRAMFHKDIYDTIEDMHGDPTKPKHYLSKVVRKTAFAGIIFTQTFVDTVTWWAEYNRAKSEFNNESDLIHSANRAVARSQASGVWSDRTPVERGTAGATVRQTEYVKIWTALGSYFFAKANIAQEVFGRTNFKNPIEVLKFSIDMMCLFTVEAVIIGIFNGTWPDDDDDESVAGWIAKETIFNAMSAFPILREAGSEVQGFRGGSVLSQFYKAVGDTNTQIGQGEMDLALVKAINRVGGITLKYPAVPTNRFIDSFIRDMHGEDVSPADYLRWYEKD